MKISDKLKRLFYPRMNAPTETLLRHLEMAAESEDYPEVEKIQAELGRRMVGGTSHSEELTF